MPPATCGDARRRRGRPRRTGPDADPLARWRGEAWLPEALWRTFDALAAAGASQAETDPADEAGGGERPAADPRLAGVRFCLDERRAGPCLVTPRALAELHEASAGGRRRAGRWYTPPAVAEALVTWALEAHLAATDAPAATALGTVRVLDPACGAGAFLLAAFHSLCDRLAALGLAATPGGPVAPPTNSENSVSTSSPRAPNTVSPEYSPARQRGTVYRREGALGAVSQPNLMRTLENRSWSHAVAARLHGWDTDPAALALASARLRWAIRCRSDDGAPARPGAGGVTPGESVIAAEPVGGTESACGGGESVAGPGHLVCGDALEALAAGAGREYGLVVTNPPWLSTRRGFGAGRRAALRAHYQTAVGQFDAYGLFIELGLRCLAPGGGFGFLVPKPLLTNQQMAPVRTLLEAERLTVLADPGPIFAAAVEPLLIAGARATPAATLALHAPGTPPRHLPLAAVIQTGGVWSWPADPASPGGAAAGREAVEDEGRGEETSPAGARLGEWFTITRGLECGKRSPGVVGAPGPGRVLLRRGEDLTAAGLAEPVVWFDRAAAGREHKPAAFFAGPKLLVRRVADRLLAAVDPSDTVALNTLYLVRPRPGCPWSLAELADWLNDPAQTAWFRQRYGTPERLFPYLRQHQLAGLPLPPRERGERV